MPETYGKIRAEVKPHWLKIRIQGGQAYARTAAIVRNNSLHTICSSGMCPNKAECWGRKTATFMILGDVCTRGCRFCATATGKAGSVDDGEPPRVARSIALMGLRHAVITSVTRDDLPDGGASHWARTIEEVRRQNPDTTIEVLIPDMKGQLHLLDIILEAGPDIAGHNIETVERLTSQVRSNADYRRSLDVIKYISSKGFRAKSGLMVGMGETDGEILSTLDDLRQAGCSILTIGQYLRPSANHWPVKEYITPDKFDYYREQALQRGFEYVASAPLVRSSYLAEEALGKTAAENKAV